MSERTAQAVQADVETAHVEAAVADTVPADTVPADTVPADTAEALASEKSDSSASDAPLRRGSYIEHDVVYAAVGASAAPDLLRFPPQGSAPFAHELKLGSGSERFLTASSTLMTWGAQRAVGIEVTDVSEGDEEHYAGVVFDAEGTPEVAPEAEVRYGPDGEPFLTAGTTASLASPGGETVRKVRVVYLVDELRRIGFALGSADEAGVIGETVYLIEHREDGTVWAQARGFHWAPENGLFGLKARAMIKAAEKDAEQLLAVLAPGAAASPGTMPSPGTTETAGDDLNVEQD